MTMVSMPVKVEWLCLMYTMHELHCPFNMDYWNGVLSVGNQTQEGTGGMSRKDW